MSNHPLNQFKDLFDDYNVIDFKNFSETTDTNKANVACTLLKIQEKKTNKGNSYAIIKLSDLSSVYELFIFSDLLETNREILREGNSLLLTIVKNISDINNRLKRFNVQKIVSIKNLYNKPISRVEFFVKTQKHVEEISRLVSKSGSTEITIVLNKDEKKKLVFKLQNKRFLDRKSLNLIKNEQIKALIL